MLQIQQKKHVIFIILYIYTILFSKGKIFHHQKHLHLYLNYTEAHANDNIKYDLNHVYLEVIDFTLTLFNQMGCSALYLVLNLLPRIYLFIARGRHESF